MSYSATLRKCIRLSAFDWRVVGELCVFSISTSLRWKQTSFRLLVQELLSDDLPGDLKTDALLADRLTWLARAFYRRFDRRSTCLKRAFVLTQLLRKHGIPAVLKIGVRKEAETIEGHAWVVACERIYLETDTAVARYQAVFDLRGIEFA